MRLRRTAGCIICLLVLSLAAAGTAFGGWTAEIAAEGETVGDAVKNAKFVIGVSSWVQALPSPSAPPSYSVLMDLYENSPEWSGPFSTITKPEFETEYKFLFGIKPGGNVMPPETRSAILTWNPEELGEGGFELRKGMDGELGVIVADMKSAGEAVIEGGQNTEYYLIVHTPAYSCDLAAAVQILQVLSGIDTAELRFDQDIDYDDKIGMAEELFVLQKIAGLR